VFRTVVAHGRGGAIVWGAGPAAELPTWSVARDEHFKFSLSAKVARPDSYRLRQLPLHFTAPRRQRPLGLWYFPVLPHTLQVNGESLTAQLGPPEGR
jgi:hypothetical protein